MKTLCVTGHRPAKLPWKYKKEGPEYDEYCESLGCYIDDCIRHGYTHIRQIIHYKMFHFNEKITFYVFTKKTSQSLIIFS